MNRHHSLGGGTLRKEIITVNEIRKFLDSIKAWNIKVHGGPAQEIGLPDVIACYKGYFIGIEVKGPGKKRNLTPRQALHQDLIRRAGGIAMVVESLEEVKEAIAKIDLDHSQDSPLR